MSRVLLWVISNKVAPLRIAVFTLALLLLPVGIAMYASEPAEFFRDKVEPILVGRCLECHGSELKGGLDLRTKELAMKGGESGQAIKPGKPDESLLFEYVADEAMPPEHPLKKSEIAVLKAWILEGAYFPEEPLDFFFGDHCKTRWL